MNDKEEVFGNTVGFWIATRLNGGSASMSDPMGQMDYDLLSVLDKKLFKRVEAVVRGPYADGMKRIASMPEPKGQKFPIGSRVRIAGGLLATVKHTYAHAFGGEEVSLYSLDVDGRGIRGWYDEERLTLIEANGKKENE